jgi:hypothetical protein
LSEERDPASIRAKSAAPASAERFNVSAREPEPLFVAIFSPALAV